MPLLFRAAGFLKDSDDVWSRCCLKLVLDCLKERIGIFVDDFLRTKGCVDVKVLVKRNVWRVCIYDEQVPIDHVASQILYFCLNSQKILRLLASGKFSGKVPPGFWPFNFGQCLVSLEWTV